LRATVPRVGGHITLGLGIWPLLFVADPLTMLDDRRASTGHRPGLAANRQSAPGVWAFGATDPGLVAGVQ
jgi:hypothetical protein